MADLDFININDCSDVSVETPESLFIDYMSKNQVKDFSDIKKYVITYSQNNNCNSSNGEIQTIDVPPNYQFGLTKINCEVIEESEFTNYYLQISGINFNLIQEVYLCLGMSCILIPHSIIDTYNTQVLLANAADLDVGTISYDLKVVTVEGFEYLLHFDFISTGVSCGATFEYNGTDYTLPTIVGTPSSSISLNDLFEQVVLFPANYYIQICEIDINNVQTCISNEEFLDCGGIFDCEFEEICDSTDNVCNLTKEIQQKHQSIIYGLKCCKEIDERILKHWIKLFCSTALEPSC